MPTRTGAYLLGHQEPGGDIGILRSDDQGETWSETVYLTSGQSWHAAPTSVLYANDRIYLVIEKVHEKPEVGPWLVGWMAPVVLSAPVSADLLDPEVWTFSNDDLVIQHLCLRPDGFPVMFFPPPHVGEAPEEVLEEFLSTGFAEAWLEGNIVQVRDPDHMWYDPSGKTFHILLRCSAGGIPTSPACAWPAIWRTALSAWDWRGGLPENGSSFFRFPGDI